MKQSTWFIVAMVACGISLLLISLWPLLSDHHQPSWRIHCASNLRQIGTGIALYANEHSGQYPDSFKTLLRHEDLVPEVFICPESNSAVAAPMAQAFEGTPADCSYIYLGSGLTTPVPDDTILALEPLEDHDQDGVNILFADGHVDFEQVGRVGMPSRKWWTDVQDQIARGVRPIRMPGPATSSSRG